MNLFGALTFGRIVKTFLPGFVVFVSLIAGIDAAVCLLRADAALHWIARNSAALMVLAIPSSLVLGLFLNSLFFAFLSKYLIGVDAYRRNNPDTLEIEEACVREMRDQVAKDLSIADSTKQLLESNLERGVGRAVFRYDFLLMPYVSLAHYQVLQDSYHYYMEFQTNLAASLGLLEALGLMRIFAESGTEPFTIAAKIWLAGILTMICVSMIVVCIKAARKNYEIDAKKRLLFFLGSLGAQRVGSGGAGEAARE